MNSKVRFWLVILTMISALALAACGGGATTGGTTGGGTPSGGETAAAALNVGTPGEELKFSPATLTTRIGSQVSVTFKNSSTALKHNWVLIKGGDDVAAKVAQEAITAGDAKGYIPDDKANVIAASKLLDGGKSETISFAAPAAGTYMFICTFPGHYQAGMKGTLTTN